VLYAYTHICFKYLFTVINSQQQLSDSNSSAELSDTTTNLWSHLFGSGAITAVEPHTVDDDTAAASSRRMSRTIIKGIAGSYHAVPLLDTATVSADESVNGSSSHSTPLGGTRAGSDIFYNVSCLHYTA
jgi:hypothetical protein